MCIRDRSKTVPFERVIFALGIRFVGETVAKKIAKSFENIDDLQLSLIHISVMTSSRN